MRRIISSASILAIACFSAGADDDNLEKVVTDWQADLFKKVSDLTDTPENAKKDFEKVQNKLVQVWKKQDKPSKSKQAAAALNHLSKAFTVGAQELANGIKSGDAPSITKGVIDMASSIFSAIGDIAGPEFGVVGAVLGFASAIMDFFMNLFGGPESHGKTSVTEIIRRVVKYELQENHVRDLQEKYEGIYSEITRIHQIFSELQPSDEKEAVSLLDDSNLKQLITQITEFCGRLEFQIKDRLSKHSYQDLQTLFQMYFQSNIHFSLIQQRAVGFIAASVTNSSDFARVPTKYFVYVLNIQNQRDRAKQFLSDYLSNITDMSKIVLVNQPGRPITHLHLRMYDIRQKYHPYPDWYIGRTAKDTGYPYASMRNEPADIEVQWEDDSKYMAKSYIDEGEWFAMVNPFTDAKEKDRTVLYMGAGKFCKYMSPSEAGDSGSNRKVDKTLFKFKRLPDSKGIVQGSGAIKDGDMVRVYSKEYDNVVMCGAKGGNGDPTVSDEDSTARYLYQTHPGLCHFDQWEVHVSGNDDMLKMADIWSRWLESLKSDDDTLGSRVLV